MVFKRMAGIMTEYLDQTADPFVAISRSFTHLDARHLGRLGLWSGGGTTETAEREYIISKIPTTAFYPVVNSFRLAL